MAIAPEEAERPYDTVLVNFARGQQAGAAYARINPKGRVPALATDNGVLTETTAVLEFVADTNPAALLRPESPLARARMREAMSDLAATVHVNHDHKKRGRRWADHPGSLEDMTAMVPQIMAASAAHLQAHCLHGPDVLGSNFSLADIHLFVICTWLERDSLRIGEFPALAAFMARMETRASVAAVRAAGLLL